MRYVPNLYQLLSLTIILSIAQNGIGSNSTSPNSLSTVLVENLNSNTTSNNNYTHEDKDDSTECFDESCGCEYRPTGPLVYCSYL